MPGEEPMVTLILSDENGSERKVQMPDMLAYKLKWDVGVTISEEDTANENSCYDIQAARPVGPQSEREKNDR